MLQSLGVKNAFVVMSKTYFIFYPALLWFISRILDTLLVQQMKRELGAYVSL